MNKEQLALLKELSETHGAPGNEGAVRDVIARHLNRFTDIQTDRLGSIICAKKGTGSGPRIMLPGHMDEIGFMVSAVTKKGFVRFAPLGGWWSQVMLAQKVRIETTKGPVVGITCSIPPHALSEEERKKPVGIKNMRIDVGASSDKEAMNRFGIRPGDTITPIFEFEVMRTLCERFPDTMIWGTDSPAYSYVCRWKQAKGKFYEFRLKGTYEDELAALKAIPEHLQQKVSNRNTLDFLFGRTH